MIQQHVDKDAVHEDRPFLQQHLVGVAAAWLGLYVLVLVVIVFSKLPTDELVSVVVSALE